MATTTFFTIEISKNHADINVNTDYFYGGTSLEEAKSLADELKKDIRFDHYEDEEFYRAVIRKEEVESSVVEGWKEDNDYTFAEDGIDILTDSEYYCYTDKLAKFVNTEISFYEGEIISEEIIEG